MVRCDENTRRGMCDRPLDEAGRCDRASDHVPTDEMPRGVDGTECFCGNEIWHGKCQGCGEIPDECTCMEDDDSEDV